MKKIIILLTSSIVPIIAIFIAILVAILMTLDFFGTNSTDGYVKDNMEYAEEYKRVLNKNIRNGYVSLERILYFYLAKDGLTFDKIYKDNLDLELKRMKPISEVCSLNEYRFLSVCSASEIKISKQIDEYQNKPFGQPLDFSKASITSFFMEQRIVFDTYDVHEAWDLAAPAMTEVKSVCDGVVSKVSFPYSANVTNTSGGGGNQIVINCKVDDTTYKVSYMHLYPGSSKVSNGQTVSKGQVIAGVGTTGYSTGNHLHYQVQKTDNSYVDGMSFVDFGEGYKFGNDYFNKPNYNHNFGN